jgi:hypothetical protein
MPSNLKVGDRVRVASEDAPYYLFERDVRVKTMAAGGGR